MDMIYYNNDLLEQFRIDFLELTKTIKVSGSGDVNSLYDVIRILQRSLTGDNTLEFEGSFIKEIFKYLVTGDTLNMIGDIDIHICTSGNNNMYSKILSDKLGIESVSGGRNTYIYKMGIDHSDIIMFKDLDEADVEVMLLNPFKSPYNVLGIPKLIFYSNGGMILQSVYENEQYVGIETPHDINIPLDEIDVNSRMVKKIDDETLLFYTVEIKQYTKAFLLLFYNKCVRQNKTPNWEYTEFYSRYIFQDVIHNAGRHELLNAIYETLYDYWLSKNDDGILNYFILFIIVYGCYFITGVPQLFDMTYENIIGAERRRGVDPNNINISSGDYSPEDTNNYYDKLYKYRYKLLHHFKNKNMARCFDYTYNIYMLVYHTLNDNH